MRTHSNHPSLHARAAHAHPDNNFTEDIFDVGAVTATFKRSVTDNQVPIRERTQVALIGADATQKGLHYDVAECTSPSHVYSENVYVVVEDLVQYAGLGSDTCATTSLFAVFDGHGGRMISEYLSFHLPLNIARQPKFSSDIEAAILSAFASTDEAVIKRIRRDVCRACDAARNVLQCNNRSLRPGIARRIDGSNGTRPRRSTLRGLGRRRSLHSVSARCHGYQTGRSTTSSTAQCIWRK